MCINSVLIRLDVLGNCDEKESIFFVNRWL